MSKDLISKFMNFLGDTCNNCGLSYEDAGEIRDFDPKTQYPYTPNTREMTEKQMDIELTRITGLIVKMTTKGASKEELTRVIKYSMVVIDAMKYRLNWRQSFRDYNITELYLKYGGEK